MEKIRQKTYDTLRWSEKYTKTDMIYLTRGGLSLLIIQVFATFFALATSITFANFFPKDAYGTYKYVLALAGIIGTFSLTGISSAVTQSVSGGFDKSLTDGFRLNLKWSFGIVLISFGASLYYWLNGNTTLSYSLIAIGLITPIMGSFSLYASYLSGKKKFEALSILSLIRFGLPTIVLIGAVFKTDSALAIIIAYLLAHASAAGICYWISKSLFKLEGISDPNIESYGKHLSLLGILNMIADQLDKIIVFHFVGAVQLAVYSFATALPNQIWGTFKSIGQLALPKFVSRDINEIRKEIGGKMLRLFFVLLVVTGVYILFAPLIFKLFFPQYLDAVIYSQFFALTLPGFVSSFPNTALNAKKAVKALYYNNVSFAIIKIALLLGFSYFWGVWGVIAARVIYEYIGVGLGMFIFVRYAKTYVEPTPTHS